MILKNRNFCRLWLSQVVLTLGGAFMQMGLLELFRARGYDVRVETAKFSFAVALPGLLLGPVAMVYLDRCQRRTVMLISDALRVGMALLIAAWLLPMLTGKVEQRDLLFVYFLVGIIGVIATFYLPARAALLPNLVERDHLIKANMLFAISLAIATVGGAAIGGVVAEKVGTAWAVLSSAVSFFISFLLLSTIRMTPHATTIPTTGGPGELRAGMVYLWKHPTALPLVLLNGFFAFLLGILMVVFVGYAMNTLELKTAGVGYLVTAGGLGAGLGMAVLGKSKRWSQSPFVPFVQLLLAAGALVTLGFTRQVWLAAVVVVVLGAVSATVLIYIDARLQAQVEDARRGAVFAARGMLTSSTMIVAFWLQFGTETLRRTPPETVLLWLGEGTAVAAAVVFVLALRGRRRGAL